MPKKDSALLYQAIINSLTDRAQLKRMRLSQKALKELLHKHEFKSRLAAMPLYARCDCNGLLALCRPVMEGLNAEPQEGWLQHIYTVLYNQLFGGQTPTQTERDITRGGHFYIAALRVFLRHDGEYLPFDPKSQFRFMAPKDYGSIGAADEYAVLMGLFDTLYLYEMFYLGRFVMPFDLLGHIAGVHHIATHMGRQLARVGEMVDLPLVSAACATHDIGKYGCKGNETRRVPYLHYYYTEEWLKRYGLLQIAHVAANHSTWDLELENLPVESLLLIYADFRVKSRRDANNREEAIFYTLRQSYDVILSKLDNVDAAKKQRYERVYAKLCDFEQYMLSLGVNEDPYSDKPRPAEKKSSVLLSAEESVQRLRFKAIANNLQLMRRISSDASFADLLEDARSDKNWTNLRTYIDIFEEYFTYMTQKQKHMTMRFLYELFMHAQGDIRAQAATLYGRILSSYDVVYRKELPPNIKRAEPESTALSVWKECLAKVLLPGHKLAAQHRAWINYTLKTLLPSLLNSAGPQKGKLFLQEYLNCFEDARFQDDAILFVLLDCFIRIPPHMLAGVWIDAPINKACALAGLSERSMQAVAMRFCLYVLAKVKSKTDYADMIKAVLLALPAKKDIAVVYLERQTCALLGDMQGRLAACDDVVKNVNTADLFLENLKTATTWVTKEVNIQLLSYRVQHDSTVNCFQVATHFANLIRVSERLAVRHAAGEALVNVAPLLTLDQRNEIAVELVRGLENASYDFSKYIPQYLGRFLLYLHPKELDEVLREFQSYLKSSNAFAACITLPVVGVMMRHYDARYRKLFKEPRAAFEERKYRMLSMLMGGLAHYSEIVGRDAFLVIGKQLFGGALSIASKNELFGLMHKKLLMLLEEQDKGTLIFFNNAASLNHIYRFIIESRIEYAGLAASEPGKVAFFPGTFDPFSTSHKGIVRQMLDMGYEVYLALDEFSWSKRTQPHMVRRRIVNMSVADMFNVYLFPDDIPINIANHADLRRLRGLFTGRDLYFAAGSDVIINASAYKAPPGETTIHTFNHIVFLRNMDGEFAGRDEDVIRNRVKGKIQELVLPSELEDVSSSRIRDNIDHNRDISMLVDPVAQGYIYDNSFYLREPQYKDLVLPETMFFERHDGMERAARRKYIDMALEQNALSDRPADPAWVASSVKRQLNKPKSRLLMMLKGEDESVVQGIACYYATSAEFLYDEFRSVALAEFARRHTSGRIAVLAGIYVKGDCDKYEITRLLITEALADCLKEDYTYALYIVADSIQNSAACEALERQGFTPMPSTVDDAPVYAVDMRSPIALIEDVMNRIKPPLSNDAEVQRVLRQTHKDFAAAMSRLYPGRLVLSFHAGLLSHALINIVMKLNGVENLPPKARQYGPCMCVPYGKPLHGVMVPNTVTKALHVDKTYMPDMKSFRITKYPGYSSLRDQVRTIKSFNRPVLLVDDLLHKGYRLEELDPLFKEAGVEVHSIVAGILSGRGKDLMSVQGRWVESVYYIPNLRYWFVDSMLYPFLGGDSVFRDNYHTLSLRPSVNQIYPYTSPAFISDVPQSTLFDLSLTCLNNAKHILYVLEQRHQAMFGFNLTLNRLSEAMMTARVPDKGGCMHYDKNLSPSVYVDNDIEMLLRLEHLLK
ncbi:MAG: hypothetical protein LBS18_02540 [Clostridiales bacterium]|jgi:nicotinic acid mononucleotide adenylyltransferase|nr:hypothetical protein [Clostridiales bacterium]